MLILKKNRFLEILLEKNLEFVLCKKDNIIAFNLNFMLLLAKIDLISEIQSRRKETLIVCNIGYIKIVLALLAKVIAYLMQTFIVYIRIFGFEKFILKYKICLVKFLVFNKQF